MCASPCSLLRPRIICQCCFHRDIACREILRYRRKCLMAGFARSVVVCHYLRLSWEDDSLRKENEREKDGLILPLKKKEKPYMASLWRKTNLICRVFSPSSLEFSVQFWYRLQSLHSLLYMFSDLPLFRTECSIHFQTRGRNALWPVSPSCEKFTLIANYRNALSPLTNTNLACILF